MMLLLRTYLGDTTAAAAALWLIHTFCRCQSVNMKTNRQTDRKTFSRRQEGRKPNAVFDWLTDWLTDWLCFLSWCVRVRYVYCISRSNDSSMWLCYVCVRTYVRVPCGLLELLCIESAGLDWVIQYTLYGCLGSTQYLFILVRTMMWGWKLPIYCFSTEFVCILSQGLPFCK